MKTSHVIMIPDDRMSSSNPYTALLCKELRQRGIELDGYTGLSQPRKPGGIVHVHWPQNFAAIGKLSTAITRSFGLLVYSLSRKILGARIIWTVHDVTSFELRHPCLEAWLMKLFVRLVDGVIYLSESTAAELEALYPVIKTKKSAVIPHGVYGNSYPAKINKADARGLLGLPTNPSIVAFVGDLKDYKQPWLAVDAFGAANVPDSYFLIWGSGPAEVESKIDKALGRLSPEQSKRVIRRNERPNETVLALVIDAIDVMMLPYRKSWNSGLGILSVERGCLVVATDEPAFVDLAAEVGKYVIAAPESNLGNALRDALAVNATLNPVLIREFSDKRSWQVVAGQHVAFYGKLIAGQ